MHVVWYTRDDVVQCTWVPSMRAVQYTSALSCVQGSTHECCSIVPRSTREFPTHVSELACKYTRERSKLACKFAYSVHDNVVQHARKPRVNRQMKRISEHVHAHGCQVETRRYRSMSSITARELR